MTHHYVRAALGIVLLSALLPRFAAAQNTRLDPAFQPPVILDGAGAGTVNDVVRQLDGKYVIGGSFTSINGVPAHNLARLNADGTLDAGFTAISLANRPVLSLALQPDGCIVAGGRFDRLAGAARTAVGRLLPTGAPDTSFDAGLNAGPDATIGQVGLLPDGAVLALSPTGPRNGEAPTGLYRLSSQTGRPDMGFQQAVAALCFAVQPDGRILTGGGSGSYVLMHLLARLLPDGRLDPSFPPLTTYFASATRQLAVDANDNIYRLGELNSNTGAGLSGPGIQQNDWGNLEVTVFQRQANGRFLVGGRLPAGAGSQPLTARLLPNGQPDISYLTANGPRTSATGTGQVHRFLTQPDGAILVAGSFTLAGSTPVHGLVRLLDSNVLSAKNALAESGTIIWPVPAREELNVTLATDAQPQQVQLLAALGRVVLSRPVLPGTAALVLDVDALAAGVYILRASYAQGAPVVRRVVLAR